MSDHRAWLKTYYGFLEQLAGLRELEPLARMAAVFRVYDGRCAICFRRSTLVVDHDHRTGLIRGDICQGCNVRARSGVAHRPISPGPSARFEVYGQYPPMAAAGLRGFYWESPDPAPDLREAIWHAAPAGWWRYEPDIFTDNAAAMVGL